MPAEKVVERRGICHSNVCGQYLAHTDQCAECGCHVEKKIAWRTASCPLGYWPAHSTPKPADI